MDVSEKRLKANRANAQKAGRPKATATLITQQSREYTTQKHP